MGWNNQAVNLIVLTEESGAFSGLFAYSPAPGPGNLVFSLAISGGTDPYGNTYTPGLAIAAGAGGAVIQLRPDLQSILIYEG